MSTVQFPDEMDDVYRFRTSAEIDFQTQNLLSTDNQGECLGIIQSKDFRDHCRQDCLIALYGHQIAHIVGTSQPA